MTAFKKLYPFASHFYDRADLKYHYLDEGEGDPIIMVHGNPSWSFYYRDAIQAVSDKYRAIVPDHIGCGFSDKPDDEHYDYTLKSRVDDLEALLDHLGITENITLLLHDWGGMIGMGYAMRYPERIKRIALLNTASFLLPESKPLPIALNLVRNTMLGAFLVQALNGFAYGAVFFGVNRRPMKKEVRQGYLKPYDSWTNRIATLRFVQDIPLKPGDPAYEIVHQAQLELEKGVFQDIPKIIFWGMKDFVFDHHFLDQWLSYWPDVEVHRYTDSGHYVLEDSSDRIIPLFRKFLDDHPLDKKKI